MSAADFSNAMVAEHVHGYQWPMRGSSPLWYKAGHVREEKLDDGDDGMCVATAWQLAAGMQGAPPVKFEHTPPSSSTRPTTGYCIY